MGQSHKIYFENLNAIRFFAALMVFVSHGIAPAYKFLHIEGTFLEKVLLTLSSGGTGVSIFFVLSGFLITYLLLTEQVITGSISIRNFYIRRILRIWPLYFAVTAFSFGLYPLFKSFADVHTELGSNVLYHLFFLSNFDVLNILQNCYGSDAMSQNITWSVSIEEQFYLFWPLIIAFIPKRFLLHGILLIALVSVGFRLYHRDSEFFLYYHTISVFIDLAMGGLFAYLTITNEKIKTLFVNTSAISQVVLLSLAFAWQLFKNDLLNPSYGHAISRVVSAFLFAMVITSQCFGDPKSPAGFGKITFANNLGKYTYGIYMLHPIILLLMDVSIRIMKVTLDNFIKTFAFGVVGFVLTLLLSYISYRYFESRFLKIKDNFSTITDGQKI